MSWLIFPITHWFKFSLPYCRIKSCEKQKQMWEKISNHCRLVHSFWDCEFLITRNHALLWEIDKSFKCTHKDTFPRITGMRLIETLQKGWWQLSLLDLRKHRFHFYKIAITNTADVVTIAWLDQINKKHILILCHSCYQFLIGLAVPRLKAIYTLQSTRYFALFHHNQLVLKLWSDYPRGFRFNYWF